MTLKLPPLLLTFILIPLMSILNWFFPQFYLNIPNKSVISIFTVVVAVLLSVIGVVSFLKANTTVNPINPEKASYLVVDGIYKFTRNPMYLGFLFFLIAWGIYLANLLSLLLVPAIFVVYMNRFQINAEEEALFKIFGDDFINYKKRVRRWL